MTPADFIAAISPAAVSSSAKTRVPASFTIAEGALESGWGSHAPGNNLFGVKADPSWTGEVTTKLTRECVAGVWHTETDNFRAYPDWQGCMDDHAAFLHSNERYASAFQCTDGIAFARAIAAAGYATDPDYADKLASIINEHNLTQFD